ncbi:hypothetical protein HK096_001610, partial [Nowakowskiella sp. JEL0078]
MPANIPFGESVLEIEPESKSENTFAAENSKQQSQKTSTKNVINSENRVNDENDVTPK